MSTTFKVRRDTAANWTTANPTLASGEPGYETDTRKIKYGDGTTAWATLPYLASATAPSANTYAANAGVTISGHTAVYVSTTDGKVYPAVADTSARFCIGVTTGGAASGASVTVQVSGVLTEPAWAWTMAQPVWLGASGALTQTQPTTGALFQVGVPLGATSLRIEPQLLALLS